MQNDVTAKHATETKTAAKEKVQMVDSRKYRGTSKFLKAGVDVGDDAITVTVAEVFTEQMRDGEDVLFAAYEEFPRKQMRLNVGAQDVLALLAGGKYETDCWIGSVVELYLVDEPMAKSGMAIRLRKPGVKKRAAPKASSLQQTLSEIDEPPAAADDASEEDLWRR